MPGENTSLKFGTSGVRGLVTELSGAPAYHYSAAFIAHQVEAHRLHSSGQSVYVGRDLRSSSAAIAQLCMCAIKDAGFTPVDCGELPTPALALRAMGASAPSIMVTGSHIPDDRNGLKFYRPDGEIDKNDELRISAHYARLSGNGLPPERGISAKADGDAVALYKNRYKHFFDHKLLSGLRIGVYQHSTAARDILVDILESLGADVISLGRAEHFIPVDTEAVRDSDKTLADQWVRTHALHALVSTDGDADRPLIADETGAFIRGDLVGAMTAAYLGIRAIVTPVTSNSRLETSGRFDKVRRTRVGSPYVIAGIDEEKKSGQQPLLGFEANGGVLLASDIARDDRILTALATRDAMLPIIACLAFSTRFGNSLQAAAASFGLAFATGGRIENVAPEKSAAFLQRLCGDAGYRDTFFKPCAAIADFNDIDGLQFRFESGDMVHFRASGNAPEFRVYVEAGDAGKADALLTWARDAASQGLQFRA